MMNIYPNPEEMAKSAAADFVRRAQEAIEHDGRFRVALSGGKTPLALYQYLANHHREDVDWPNVRFYWSDERYVPPTDPESNEGAARVALFDTVLNADANVHGMYILGGAEEAAKQYRDLLGDEPLDLIMLGIGTDGHTASLFPGSPAVNERELSVLVTQAPVGVRERISMTPAFINRSPVMFLVSGADKAQAMNKVLRGEENWDETPAQAIARRGKDVHWFMDQASSTAL